MAEENQAGPPPADQTQIPNPTPPAQEPAVPTTPPPAAPVPVAPSVSPVPVGTVDPIAAPTSSPAAAQGNTSGQGSGAAVPEEVKGWSWGGFFLTWIWGIGNSVWIALIALIVPIPLLMNIVLGVKGREWAWQAKHWDSVEQFNKTQKTWGMVGLILAIIGIVFAILWFIFVGAVIISAINSGTTSGTTTTY